MNSHYTSGSGSGAAGNNGSFATHRREMRAANGTGALPAIPAGRSYSGSVDFDNLIVSLRELFEHDRQVASQQDSARCGICYLYYTIDELRYREEEGFYACNGCERTLGRTTLRMIRRQQK